MKSWKIGAIAGLVAGIIATIVNIIQALIEFNIGIPYWYLDPPPITPILRIATTEITFNIIWGIILGIIYSRIYDIIPGKAVSKGLLFGLAYYLIYSIRWVTWTSAYGYFDIAISFAFMMAPIAYGLVLGILHKILLGKSYALKEELKISMHDMRRGIISGIVASFFGSIGAIMSALLGVIIGIMEYIPGYLTDIGFLISQFGAHIVINIFWFGICGLFYAMFYNRIPGKGLTKGLYFGLILFLILNVRISMYYWVYGLFFAIGWAVFVGFFSFLTYGLAIGILYKK